MSRSAVSYHGWLRHVFGQTHGAVRCVGRAQPSSVCSGSAAFVLSHSDVKTTSMASAARSTWEERPHSYLLSPSGSPHSLYLSQLREWVCCSISPLVSPLKSSRPLRTLAWPGCVTSLALTRGFRDAQILSLSRLSEMMWVR